MIIQFSDILFFALISDMIIHTRFNEKIAEKKLLAKNHTR